MSSLYKINASAGSGKTYRLTRRYLELLSASNKGLNKAQKENYEYAFSEILAVTFTNLAASQMQDRIILALKQIALGDNPEDDPWTDDEAKRALEQIFHRYSALKIKTIDSLLQQLVRLSALDLEISPEFETCFDNAELMEPLFQELAKAGFEEESYDAEVEELFENISEVLIYESSDFKKFLAGSDITKKCLKIAQILREQESQSLCGYLAETADLLTVLQEKSRENPELAKDLEAYIEEFNSLEYLFENMDAQTMDGQMSHHFASYDELDALQTEIRDNVTKLANELFSYVTTGKLSLHAGLKKWFEAWKNKDYKDTAYLKKISVFEVLTGKNKEFSGEVEDAYQNLCEVYIESLPLLTLLAHAQKYACVVELSQKLEKQAFLEEKNNALLLSSRMPSLVSKVLCDNNYLGNAFCRLGAKLNHILFDEFQDTSKEQWRALSSLCKEALSVGGSVLFVGDVKQAIYNWRGGDAETFNQAPLELQNALSMAVNDTNLPCNYRSEQGVIEWNNSFFHMFTHNELLDKFLATVIAHDSNQDLSPALEVSIEKYARQISACFEQVRQEIPPHKTHNPSHGMVQVHRINLPEDKATVGTLALVAEAVENLGKRHKWQDICVLTVTNAQASQVSEILLAQGIPVISQGSLLVAEHPVIIELIAFLHFLANPMDDQAFWQILVSKSVLPESFSGDFTVGDFETELFSFLSQNRKTSLSQDFKHHFPQVWQKYFKPLIDGAGLMSAYDTLCDIYQRFDVKKRNQGAEVFLLRLLEIVHLTEDSSFMDLHSFLGWWEEFSHKEKAPLPQNAEAVSVMTVHKSKGLEFEAVLMPWCDFNIVPRHDEPITLNVEYNDKSYTVLSSLKKGFGIYYQQAMLEKSTECLNNLYVAWTRAVKELHIFMPEESKTSFGKAVCYALEEFFSKKKEYKLQGLETFEDFICYGHCAQKVAENDDVEIIPTSSLLDAQSLRVLEYILCEEKESFEPVYEEAKKALGDITAQVDDFVLSQGEDFSQIASADSLYFAKKIQFFLNGLKPSRLKKTTREKTKDAEDFSENSVGEYDLIAERPMSWLPRIKVFRNNLEDLRSHAVLTANKRGTLIHKSLECLTLSGDDALDAKRAVKDSLSTLPTYVPHDEDLAEFQNIVSWFLSLETPYGSSKEWLAYGLKEHGIASKDGKMYRVDMLMTRPRFLRGADDEVELLAIDYKTGYDEDLPNKDNVAQMKNYLNLLREATGKEQSSRVKGLLVYLDRQTFYEVE